MLPHDQDNLSHVRNYYPEIEIDGGECKLFVEKAVVSTFILHFVVENAPQNYYSAQLGINRKDRGPNFGVCSKI